MEKILVNFCQYVILQTSLQTFPLTLKYNTNMDKTLKINMENYFIITRYIFLYRCLCNGPIYFYVKYLNVTFFFKKRGNYLLW